MSAIVAGSFRHIAETEPVIEALEALGIPKARYQVFHVNAPGQHAVLASGGDVDKDSGAQHTDTGVTVGAVTGGVAGAVIGTAVGGPLGAMAGAGVGAYVGSLGGALASTQDGDTEGSHSPQAAPEERAPRRGGVLIAVSIADARERVAVIDSLRRSGAEDIEATTGEWRDRDWIDFDPTRPPSLVEPASIP